MGSPPARKTPTAVRTTKRPKPAARAGRPKTFDLPPGPFPEGAIPTLREINELREFAKRVRQGAEPLTYTKR
jgi:hypothetical protein